ncbi:DNA-directed DNA polymerase [Tanacetum coccineum]
MTGNKCYLDEYEDYDGGFVSFGDGKGRISGKAKIKIGLLDFDDVYFCKELKYNMFSIVDLKSVVPTGGLTCLIAKATIDESNTWHRRLGHINFKTMNKLVNGNLVKGLPSKIFENDHSCVALSLTESKIKNEASDKSGKHDQEARSGSERIFQPFKNAFTLLPVPNISSMDNTGIFGNAYDDEDVEEEIEEEVYVCQPPGFEDPHFPDKVYKGKLDKELCSLKDLKMISASDIDYDDDIIFGSNQERN